MLASILMPALSRARERARIATCASNLKQIGQALHMYANDFGNAFPFWAENTLLCFNLLLGYRGSTKIGTVYLKTPETFICPSDRSSRKSTYPYLYSSINCSYAYACYTFINFYNNPPTPTWLYFTDGAPYGYDTEPDTGVVVDKQVPQHIRTNFDSWMAKWWFTGRRDTNNIDYGRKIIEKNNHNIMGINVLFVDNSVHFINSIKIGGSYYIPDIANYKGLPNWYSFINP
ncbi:MAG: DUF1559 domain-containing protein [bacterium]|nr:DUF1559 domain-containing protein [bacterium]